MSETTNSHGRSRQAPRQPEPGGEGQTWAQRTHPQGRPLQAQPTATLAKLRAAACGLTGPLQERPPCPDMLTPLAICNKSGTPCPFPPARRLLIEVPHALREPGYNTLVIGARLGEALDLIAKAREAGWLAAPLEWLTECPPGTIASVEVSRPDEARAIWRASGKFIVFRHDTGSKYAPSPELSPLELALVCAAYPGAAVAGRELHVPGGPATLHLYARSVPATRVGSGPTATPNWDLPPPVRAPPPPAATPPAPAVPRPKHRSLLVYGAPSGMSHADMQRMVGAPQSARVVFQGGMAVVSWKGSQARPSPTKGPCTWCEVGRTPRVPHPRQATAPQPPSAPGPSVPPVTPLSPPNAATPSTVPPAAPPRPPAAVAPPPVHVVQAAPSSDSEESNPEDFVPVVPIGPCPPPEVDVRFPPTLFLRALAAIPAAVCFLSESNWPRLGTLRQYVAKLPPTEVSRVAENPAAFIVAATAALAASPAVTSQVCVPMSGGAGSLGTQLLDSADSRSRGLKQRPNTTDCGPCAIYTALCVKTGSKVPRWHDINAIRKSLGLGPGPITPLEAFIALKGTMPVLPLDHPDVGGHDTCLVYTNTHMMVHTTNTPPSWHAKCHSVESMVASLPPWQFPLEGVNLRGNISLGSAAAETRQCDAVRAIRLEALAARRTVGPARPPPRASAPRHSHGPSEGATGAVVSGAIP